MFLFEFLHVLVDHWTKEENLSAKKKRMFFRPKSCLLMFSSFFFWGGGGSSLMFFGATFFGARCYRTHKVSTWYSIIHAESAGPAINAVKGRYCIAGNFRQEFNFSLLSTAVASGMSLATPDGANPTVVEDSLSGLVEGTAARADVEQLTLRPSLPRACKKSRTLQVQLTGKPKGKPKPPSERKRVPATKEATPVVPACGTQVVEGQSTRASLPRACKMTENTCTKPEDTPSEMLLAENKPSREKPVKKPSDYQSAVARHLAEDKGCALAYSDNSFRVVRVCPLTVNLEIMEALYIRL